MHVTYGAMGREPLTIANSLLIFKALTFRGFHVDMWKRSKTDEELETMWDTLADMVAAGELMVPVDSTYSLRQCSEAVTHAYAVPRNGKILFDMSK